MGWEGKPQATDEQIREYGYQATANGDPIAVKRAHHALSVPVSPSWESAWQEYSEARAVIWWDINRVDSPYAHLTTTRTRST